MSTLYLSEQGATVRYRQGRLQVTQDETLMATVPPAEIDHIACFGRVAWTAPAMAECLKRGIAISLHTTQGHCRGLVQPDNPAAGILREAQWRAVLDPIKRLAFARTIVTTKCHAAIALLESKRKDGAAPPKTRQRLRECVRDAASAPNLDALLGCEGNAARIYYERLRTLLPPTWGFNCRQYRPAPDPINALLSFAYGCANNQLAGELTAVGLDLAAGFLHRPQRNRPSLSLDLLEPFRPLVCDRLVLRLVRMHVIHPDDFDTQPNGACRMKPTTEKRIIKAYDDIIHTPHAALDGASPAAAFRAEAQRLARALRGEEAPWQPLPWLT